jgi:ribosomal protein S27E
MPNQDYKEISQENVDTSYRTDGTKCPICGNLEIAKITKEANSDVACTLCGAIFYSIDHYDYKKAGYFTGRYLDMPSENIYKLNEMYRQKEKEQK